MSFRLNLIFLIEIGEKIKLVEKFWQVQVTVGYSVQQYICLYASRNDGLGSMQGIQSLYGAGAKLEPLDSVCLNLTVVVLI